MNINVFTASTFWILFTFLFSCRVVFIKLCKAQVKCIDSEREILVSFKEGLTDPSSRLSSWKGEECCNWDGIKCSNQTGRVTELDLRNPFPLSNIGDQSAYKKSCLGGKLCSCLLGLKDLTYLDLSFNDFEGSEIPEFVGGFENLRYLNLSYSSFAETIPLGLGNLSRLVVLDLNADSYDTDSHELRADNLRWLASLSSLKYLNLGSVKLTDVGSDWFQAVNSVPSLVELHLHYCDLKDLPQSIPFLNLTSLSVLDLSDNSFNSLIPHWLFNLTSLTKLYLYWNFFTGHIPVEFGKLTSLEVLELSNNLDLGGEIPNAFGNLSQLKVFDLSANDLHGEIYDLLSGFVDNPKNKLISLRLSSNSLEGQLPDSLGALHNLQSLYLSGNSFSGSIPISMGNLRSLQILDLSYNSMNGTIPESLGLLSELVSVDLMANSWQGMFPGNAFKNLGKLKIFRLTTDLDSSCAFNLSPKWTPPFRLNILQLVNCLVGPSFPVWLQVQTQLTSVTLSNVGIADNIPAKWFSVLSSKISYLVLSNNQIKGIVPNGLEAPNLRLVDLSSNKLEGPLPIWTSNTTEQLRFHDNSFSGSITEDIGRLVPNLQNLYLSWNRLSGGIPKSLCQMQSLQVISLRSNRLTGEFPSCWHRLYRLWAIDVSKNNLVGDIPTSLNSLPSLSILLLSENHFTGEFPPLQNCSGLTSIDLHGNKISGSLPAWVAENFASLFMLRLGSNLLSGPIPEQFCHLRNVHILDVSNNKFSGPVPTCVSNLTGLRYGNNSEVFEGLIYAATKGRNNEYSSIVSANVNSLNLAGNNLSGDIPDEIANLQSLRQLNLSRNHLTGKIIEKIENLQQLEALDLSHNHLNGMIPQGLGFLASLTRLNLSYNNLEGKIPSDLQKFNDPSIFIGNPSLCGPPLPTKCPNGHKIHS